MDKILTTLITVILGVLLGVYLSTIFFNPKAKENENLIQSLNSELVVWKDKDSINHTKIQVIETYRVKDFIELKSKDSVVRDLQKTVEIYKKKLKEKGSVTNIHTTTDIGASSSTQVVLIDSVYPEYRSSFNLKDWVVGKTIANKDSTTINFSIKNNYSVVIGQDSNGWFKKPTPFVEVTNDNPYTKIKTLRTYQVTTPRIKRIVIGPGISYGLDGKVRPSINATYGIIRF